MLRVSSPPTNSSTSKVKQTTMETKEIIEALDMIRSKTDDPEMAHSLEDELYSQFIDYVANGNATATELAIKAELVLSTQKMDFPRWCA